MQLNLWLWGSQLVWLVGLLCIALSQPAHSAHPQWSVRLNSVGLSNALRRRIAGVLLALGSAAGMASLEGLGMGLVLWVMAGSFHALVVTWVLSRQGSSTTKRNRNARTPAWPTAR